MKELKTTSSYLLSVQDTMGMRGRGDRGQFHKTLYLTAQRVYNTERQVSLTTQELLNALQKSL
jgi:murein tripeptide amidase MpaA